MGSKKQLAKVRREWDDKIKRPLTVSNMIKMYEMYTGLPENRVKYQNDVVVLFASSAIRAWAQNHETIYAIDPDLQDSLVASGMPDAPVPAEVFDRFPHEAPLYLFGTPVSMQEGPYTVDYEGFIVDRVLLSTTGVAVRHVPANPDGSVDLDDETVWGLRLVFFGHQRDRWNACIISTATIPLEGDQWTVDGKVDLEGCMRRLMDVNDHLWNEVDEWSGVTAGSEWHSDRTPAASWKDTQVRLFPVAVAAMLYTLSDQPDMARVSAPRQAGSGRISNAKFSMVDVGIRIGAALRNSRSLASKSPSTGLGASKAPHIRRGHWHRFWTGPRDGERKVILRWLPPIPVNLDKGLVISTVRPVVKSDNAA